MSAKTAAATETEEDGEEMTYLEQKRARKEAKREMWKDRLERREKQKTRRDGRERGLKSAAFKSFFIPKKVNEEYMNRKARQANLDWKLDVAVIVQRYHVLLPDPPKWMADFEDLTKQLAPYRDPSVNWPKECQWDAERDLPASRKEERDRWWIENLFPPGYVHPPSRITEADKSGNTRTIDRKLLSSVFLFVKGKGKNDNNNEEGRWNFPTVSLQPGEMLLEAGRRAMAETVGDHGDLVFYCPSNAPLAVDMVPLPEDERAATGLYGTKTFFYKFERYTGDLKDPNLDFAWLAKDEYGEHLKERGATEEQVKFYHYVL